MKIGELGPLAVKIGLWIAKESTHGYSDFILEDELIAAFPDASLDELAFAVAELSMDDFINTTHFVANTSSRSSAIDGRTTRHRGYAASQRIRKRIEEAFGWIKTIARQEKTSFRGRDRVGWAFTFAAAAYNLVRLPKLMAGAGSWPRCPASPRPLPAAGASSKWTPGTATSSILSKRRISPSRVSRAVKLPSVH
ncbi:hypothetical protein ABH994_005604 [Bradyrhizobium yuanmingense]